MFFTFFLLSSVYISTVNGWGATGHALVAKIAQTMLTTDSTKFIRDNLPWYTAGNLGMLASWPDTITDPNTNPVDYLNWEWSKELHYVNTPDWICKYDRNRDCDWSHGQRCVDGAIQNYTGRLASKKQDAIQKQEALKFLVHLIGDVHQPLHGGFVSDRGGNSIRGLFFDQSTNLHALWDTGMIDRRISKDFQSDSNQYYNYLLNLLQTTYANDISQWSKCPSADQSRYLACSTAWIDEDTELNCAQVYLDEQGKVMTTSQQFRLGQTYYNTRIAIVEQRLLKSAVRLGTVINAVVELHKHKHHDDDDDELCAGTIILIVVIFVEVLLAFCCVAYCIVRRKRADQPLAKTPPKYQVLSSKKMETFV